MSVFFQIKSENLSIFQEHLFKSSQETENNKKEFKTRVFLTKNVVIQRFVWYSIKGLSERHFDYPVYLSLNKYIRKNFGGGEIRMAKKAELVLNVANAVGDSKKSVAPVVDAVFEQIEAFLADGEKVQLIGFGSFEVRDRAARKGRNPQTGDEIEIPASKVPAFKPGKALKDAVK